MKLWLGRLISITALFFVGYFLFTSVQNITWGQIDIRITYLIVSLLSGLLYFFLRNYAWAKLIRQRTFAIGVIPAAHYFSTSEIIRYIPGNVWGLGARIIKGPKYGIPKKSAVMLLIEDTALLLLTVTALSGLGLLITPGLESVWRLLGILLIFSLSLIFLLPYLIHKGSKIISKIFSFAFVAADISIKRLSKLIPLYITLWLSYAFCNVFLFYGIFSQTTNTFVLILTFSIFSWLIGYASLLTPSGLGVRELIFSIGLTGSIPAAIASLFSLISRVWLTLIELLFYFVVMLLHRGPVTQEPFTFPKITTNE